MGYVGRGVLGWILIAFIEVVHGIVRNLFLKPHVGDLASNLVADCGCGHRKAGPVAGRPSRFSVFEESRIQQRPPCQCNPE